mmetsp:Transcript_39176/g.62578  ORF Transcript_39176/g.62578 Transcript_39176/m.62578 type:complete len:285 (+) Transcript_39176:65-919(+)
MKRHIDEMKMPEKMQHSGLITSPLRIELDLLATKGFHAVKYYYANIIDYVRVMLLFMCNHYLLGMHNPDTSQSDIVIAGLLMFSSMMLDWIDGPIARRFQQCSYFGLVVDYIADVLGDIILLCWFSIEGNYVLSMISWFNVCISVSSAVIGCTLSYVGIEYELPVYANYDRTKEHVVFGSVLPAAFWRIVDIMLDYVNSTTMKYSNFGCFCWMGYYWWQVSVASIISCERIATCSDALLQFHWASVYVFFVPFWLEIWLGVAFAIVLLSVWSERIIKLKIIKLK